MNDSTPTAARQTLRRNANGWHLGVLSGPVHSAVRTAGPEALAEALQTTRTRTLGLMQAWQNALSDLSVPPLPEMNPPLWEWGHIAWFQEWWTVRNRQRHLGTRSARSGEAFGPSLLPDADALYNSSDVAHDSRWALALPDLAGTQAYLAQVLQRSLAHLKALQAVQDAGQAASDEALYFWRLVLQHEDMHNEASVYMAQALGLHLPQALCWRTGPGVGAEVGAAGHAHALPAQIHPTQIHVPAQVHTLGHSGPGFAFDNELQAQPVALAAFDIDAAAVSWARYLPFVQATGHALPPHVRWFEGMWQAQHFGQWQALDMQAPAVHVNADDAQAWCEWASRRLPTEAEWECAAHTPDFAWGQVWEWTASDFAPYPGFEAHPYREYSAPWWHDHRVLRGASAATSAHVVDVRYRNFFVPERRDIFAGFRSVAL
ncbi:MAG: SUMF1/EgtB/PvdO family nonheme iron enzyme [Limnohabitans sp.]|nr:SUMF1/EgtB/PvdO family nonheme iron enzyme [Limnohabitans sp.]